MTLNKIFENNKETAMTVSIPWGKKNCQRIIGIKRIAKSVWCGTVTKNKKVTGRWVWDMHRFDNPVFISSIVMVNGKPKRYTKLPLCEKIKDLVRNEIGKQKWEETMKKGAEEHAVKTA